MKKQWVLFLSIAGSILGSVWLVRQVSQKPAPEPVTITLADESARIAFLQEHGFPDGVCIAAERVQLPAEEDAVYDAYAALQRAQGLPLDEYCGESATRYTYAQNSPEQGTLRAELLCHESQMLIGAVTYSSTAPETFTALFS